MLKKFVKIWLDKIRKKKANASRIAKGRKISNKTLDIAMPLIANSIKASQLPEKKNQEKKSSLNIPSRGAKLRAILIIQKFFKM